jgi:hypothetical protein
MAICATKSKERFPINGKDLTTLEVIDVIADFVRFATEDLNQREFSREKPGEVFVIAVNGQPHDPLSQLLLKKKSSFR